MKQLHLNFLNMIGILMIELASNTKNFNNNNNNNKKKQSKPVANLNASKATKSPITLFKKVNYFINLTFKKKGKLYS